MLNFAICDDNLIILDRMQKMLNNIFSKNGFEANVTYTTDESDEMLNFIKHNKVDVIMLDINLNSNKSGLELAKSIRKINKESYIIFTTRSLRVCYGCL